MSIKNKAEDLAKELTNCQEYKAYIKAKEKLEKDESNLSLLKEFKKKNWEVQVAQIIGQDINEESINQVEEIYQLISLNNDINEFLTAEYCLNRLLGDVQKILAQSVEHGFDLMTNNNLLN